MMFDLFVSRLLSRLSQIPSIRAKVPPGFSAVSGSRTALRLDGVLMTRTIHPGSPKGAHYSNRENRSRKGVDPI